MHMAWIMMAHSQLFLPQLHIPFVNKKFQAQSPRQNILQAQRALFTRA